MRPLVCLAALFLATVPGCARTDPSRPSMAAAQDAGPPRPVAGPSAAPSRVPAPGVAESLLRMRIGPVVRFHLVPVGKAAVEPARAALPALRDHFTGYGFDLGATLESLPAAAKDCTAFVTSLVGARGTLFVVARPLPCATAFGALDVRTTAAVVLLPPLGAPGTPEAARRLEALLAADVGELIGLSYPCLRETECCPLRTAPSLAAFDLRAASRCPQHPAELGRIRTDAGLQ